MSTHASIGYLNSDGTVRTIYNHSDGYVQCLGQYLVQHYASHILANALIDMGNMSSIKRNINAPQNENHSFDDRQRDTCTFYHRDRGDAWTENRPTVYEDLYAWRNASQQDFTAFQYLWMLDAWHVSLPDTGHWLLLTDHEDFTVKKS